MEANKKFVVDKGHSRGTQISSEEIDQALRDILAWLSTNVPNFSPPGPSNRINQLQNPPLALLKMLQSHNGGIQLQETFITISVEEILDAIEVGRVSIYWKNGYFPFARNIDGEFLVVDGEGGVFHWNLDIGIVEQVGESLALFLETLRNNMLSRKYQYLDEDCGLVESV
ncbi:unnamed protein product [Blepharisma stoltei]|uniref:Knr4/Smi1-like domain-containing protein n=1 Tax=Blepharisma stoltei TaxID=1481888 RepID=A0AAU9JZX5_9CILI|nr:unnamed protein product [Blepharisma stoltei]